MLQTLLASFIAFASSNIDDIFVLMLFFGQRHLPKTDIYIGQYLGVLGLWGLSWLGSLLGYLVNPAYIGFLGLMPVYLGLKGCYALLYPSDETSQSEDLPDARSYILPIAGITFANGGDNISIYVPMLAVWDAGAQLLMLAVFVLMIWLWCRLAQYLSARPAVSELIQRYGDRLIPAVLLLLGLFIMYESGSFGLLLG